MLSSKEKGKEKETTNNNEVVINVNESSETTPLLWSFKKGAAVSTLFATINTKKPIASPIVKSSEILKQIRFVLEMLSRFHSDEENEFIRQRNISRNSIIKKFNIILGAYTPLGLSAVSTVCSWVSLGVISNQARHEWREILWKLRVKMSYLHSDWSDLKIPGEEVTCHRKYAPLRCDKLMNELVPFCEQKQKQYCEIFNDYITSLYEGSNFDITQIILLFFAIIATLAFIALLIAAVCNWQYFSNIPTIPAPNYFGSKNWKQPLKMDNAKLNEINELLDQLESLTGIKAPNELDNVILYLKRIGQVIHKSEQEYIYLLYLLENPRHENRSEIYHSYAKVRETLAPQIVLDMLSESVFNDQKVKHTI